VRLPLNAIPLDNKSAKKTYKHNSKGKIRPSQINAAMNLSWLIPVNQFDILSKLI
jgi:hypothetical protein